MKGRWDSSDEESESKNVVKTKKQKVASAPTTTSHQSATISSKSSVDSKVSALSTQITVQPKPVMDVQVNISQPEEQKVTEEPAATVQKEEPYNPLFHGCRSVECYQRLNFIDQGTYGLVFRAEDVKTKEVYALKQVKLTAKETNKVGFPITALREINILLALQHPNIVKVKEMVVGSSIDKIYMVMEYCENDLKMCMKTSQQSFSIAEIKTLMIQLLSAVEHMHKLWYIHRDLKTSNLLYSNKGVLCVCDFGLARKYGDPLQPYTHEVVTLWYRAPELLLGSRIYSIPIDMWSVGCIFAEMVTGDPLFPGQGEVDQISKIFTALGAPNDSIWPGFADLPNFNMISKRIPNKGKLASMFPTTSFSGSLTLNESGFNLLTQMLQMDPARRISASDALKHPWLTTEAPYPTPTERMPRFKSKHETEP